MDFEKLLRFAEEAYDSYVAIENYKAAAAVARLTWRQLGTSIPATNSERYALESRRWRHRIEDAERGIRAKAGR